MGLYWFLASFYTSFPAASISKEHLCKISNWQRSSPGFIPEVEPHAKSFKLVDCFSRRTDNFPIHILLGYMEVGASLNIKLARSSIFLALISLIYDSLIVVRLMLRKGIMYMRIASEIETMLLNCQVSRLSRRLIHWFTVHIMQIIYCIFMYFLKTLTW